MLSTLINAIFNWKWLTKGTLLSCLIARSLELWLPPELVNSAATQAQALKPRLPVGADPQRPQEEPVWIHIADSLRAVGGFERISLPPAHTWLAVQINPDCHWLRLSHSHAEASGARLGVEEKHWPGVTALTQVHENVAASVTNTRILLAGKGTK